MLCRGGVGGLPLTFCPLLCVWTVATLMCLFESLKPDTAAVSKCCCCIFLRLRSVSVQAWILLMSLFSFETGFSLCARWSYWPSSMKLCWYSDILGHSMTSHLHNNVIVFLLYWNILYLHRWSVKYLWYLYNVATQWSDCNVAEVWQQVPIETIDAVCWCFFCFDGFWFLFLFFLYVGRCGRKQTWRVEPEPEPEPSRLWTRRRHKQEVKQWRWCNSLPGQ